MSEKIIKDEYLAGVLRGENTLLFDGGMGTLLMAEGLFKPGHIADILCVENPEAIIAIQKRYADAGAQVITTNTFNSNPPALAREGYSVDEVFAAAVTCAREAGAQYVAGDIGPIGEMLEPYGDLSEDEAYDYFAQEVKAICAAGADFVSIETMMDINEMSAAIRAAQDFGNLPIFATMSYSCNGRTMWGNTPEEATATICEMGVDVVGTNCSCGPVEMLPIAEKILSVASCPVIVQANAGMPETVNGKQVYTITASEYAAAVKDILDAGVTIIGGCCGTTPEIIQEVAKLI